MNDRKMHWGILTLVALMGLCLTAYVLRPLAKPKAQASRISTVHRVGSVSMTLPSTNSLPAPPISQGLPSDPVTAWAEVQKRHQALRPPAGWKGRQPTLSEVSNFTKEIQSLSVSSARYTREFIQRFPTNENVDEARVLVVDALNHAVAADDRYAEIEAQKFVAEVLKDKNIPENDRVRVFLISGDTAYVRQIGMSFYAGRTANMNGAYLANWQHSVRQALHWFPTNSFLCCMLLAAAEVAPDQTRVESATEILLAPGASARMKVLAKNLLDGTKLYDVGRPIDIRFTALDGRDVDLARLRGKVILVEFWSTSCGPCVMKMPQLKALYEELHDQGLEVIGISYDLKEPVLRRFIAEKGLPWPQYFDGKGWENRFALRYGVFTLPTMWIVDREGNLRDSNANLWFDRELRTLVSTNRYSNEDDLSSDWIPIPPSRDFPARTPSPSQHAAPFPGRTNIGSAAAEQSWFFDTSNIVQRLSGPKDLPAVPIWPPSTNM
jgi:thiol-disulfide isomerase/thioredoxin